MYTKPNIVSTLSDKYTIVFCFKVQISYCFLIRSWVCRLSLSYYHCCWYLTLFPIFLVEHCTMDVLINCQTLYNGCLDQLLNIVQWLSRSIVEHCKMDFPCRTLYNGCLNQLSNIVQWMSQSSAYTQQLNKFNSHHYQ